MENDNYNTGGTGAALFAGKSADAANGQVQTHFTSSNLTTVLKIFVCPSPYFFLTIYLSDNRGRLQSPGRVARVEAAKLRRR